MIRSGPVTAEGESAEAGVLASIELERVGVALVACDRAGRVLGGSPSGKALLTRIGMAEGTLPTPLPSGLWQLLSSRDVGVAVTWHGGSDGRLMLGCTRYALTGQGWLLVMSEISEKQSVLAEQLQKERMEAMARLIGLTANDLRSPLSSIVFNSDVLVARLGDLPNDPAQPTLDRARELAEDIRAASARLRDTVDCIFDYARIGPATLSSVSIKGVLARMQSLLRPLLRAGAHRILIETSDELDHVSSNAIAVEQIFLSLLLNSVEAAEAAVTVRVSSQREGAFVRVLVEDDGPGIRVAHPLQIFDPFFTTKPDASGVGLTAARETARAAGGDLELVRWQDAAAFAVRLPFADTAARA